MSKLPVVVIKCDVNDADYIHNILEVDVKDLDTIRSIANKISKFKPYVVNMPTYSHTVSHNFLSDPRTDMGEKTIREIYDFTEEESEVIDQYFPYGFDGMPVHSLESIEIIEIKETLFVREL